MENETKNWTFDVPKDCLLAQISDELKEANKIIERVSIKYKLKYGDIYITPLFDHLALSIRIDNLLSNPDTPTMASLLGAPPHTKK